MHENQSREELLQKIENLERELKKQKKYGLVWERVESGFYCEDKVTPALIHNKNRSFQTGEREVKHLLIEGDNFHALTALQTTHKRKVDMIIIDPPYNRGNNVFRYSDRFTEANHEWKHSKWLSFMEQRLRLATELLADTGAIFICIDDHEQAHLKLLCDDIFGEQNFIANLVRKCKTGSGHDSAFLAVEYEYILCYAKDKSQITFAKETLNVKEDNRYKLEDDYVATRGKYYLRDLNYKGRYIKSLDYLITCPDGTVLWAGGKQGEPNTWRWSKEKVQWGIEQGFVVFKQGKQGWKVYIKQYQFVDNEGNFRVRTLPYRALVEFLNREGSTELHSVLPQATFQYPKPIRLIQYLLKLSPNQNALILDFFAGSGTTGQAVLELNKEDGGRRQFILCTNNEVDEKTAKQLQKEGKSKKEMEEYGICRGVTYPRLKKVMQGWDSFQALGGNLDYFEIQLPSKP